GTYPRPDTYSHGVRCPVGYASFFTPRAASRRRTRNNPASVAVAHNIAPTRISTQVRPLSHSVPREIACRRPSSMRRRYSAVPPMSQWSGSDWSVPGSGLTTHSDSILVEGTGPPCGTATRTTGVNRFPSPFNCVGAPAETGVTNLADWGLPRAWPYFR